MRNWLIVLLFVLFYFSNFPSLTITDLAIISLLVLVAGVMAAKILYRSASGLVEEAYNDKIDGFIRQSWATYRTHGFNRDMTYRLANCLIVIICVKYGFDVIRHAAAHVPAAEQRAYWAELIGATIVLGFTIKEGVWLRLASNFRRDFQGRQRLSIRMFFRLYARPVGVCCAVLYAPTLVRLSVAVGMHGLKNIFPSSALFAAPAHSVYSPACIELDCGDDAAQSVLPKIPEPLRP
jgi:hypothetical protein